MKKMMNAGYEKEAIMNKAEKTFKRLGYKKRKAYQFEYVKKAPSSWQYVWVEGE